MRPPESLSTVFAAASSCGYPGASHCLMVGWCCAPAVERASVASAAHRMARWRDMTTSIRAGMVAGRDMETPDAGDWYVYA